MNQQHFRSILPLPTLSWNGRLRSSAGRFFPGSRRDPNAIPPRIEIASYLRTEAEAKRLVEDTLLHEMIHYWLWHHRRPYGHTAEFKQWLKKTGASRYNSVARIRPPAYMYACPACMRDFPARKRLRTVACKVCCDRFSNGKFDARFKLFLKTNLKTS